MPAPWKNHVLIATPTLFVALLRAVAYGWREEDVAANARQISDVGRELYDRVRGFAEHFSKVGDGLHRGDHGLQRGGRFAGTARAAQRAQTEGPARLDR